MKNVVRKTILTLLAAGIFTMAIAGQTLTTLATFTGANGANPGFFIQGSDGNFYGITQDGGSSTACNGNEFSPHGGCGTIWQITPTGTLTMLYSFSLTDGAFPSSTLVEDSDGNFIGTTLQGGTFNAGTIFKISPSGTFTSLYNFSGYDGDWPTSSVTLASDGNYYGNTLFGGAFGQGNIYQLTPGGTVTAVYSFSGGADGALPSSQMQKGGGGYLYGTTNSGSYYSSGTLFAFNVATSVTTIMFHFNGTNGSIPCAPLLLAAPGVLVGMTAQGGTYGDGTVFRFSGSTPPTFTTVENLNLGSDLIEPNGCSFVKTSSGLYYAVANSGGTYGDGAVYRFALDGSHFAFAYNFGGADGTFPFGLVAGSDGAIYGTTYEGGTGNSNQGTFFKLTP